jgi:hypothetical protein
MHTLQYKQSKELIVGNTPVSLPSRTYESITMDLFRGLPRKKSGNDYFIVVVDRFNKMFVLTPCKKTIKSQEIDEKILDNVLIIFCFPRSNILYRDTRFLSTF